MKKFNAIYKRGNVEKAVVIEIHEDGKHVVIDEKGSKEMKAASIKRWYTIGEEIVEKKAAEKKKRNARTEVKLDGSIRQDKFKPKMNADQVLQMLKDYDAGVIKAQLARDYQVSYRTVTCVVEGLMWKDVFSEYHTKKSA